MKQLTLLRYSQILACTKLGSGFFYDHSEYEKHSCFFVKTFPFVLLHEILQSYQEKLQSLVYLEFHLVVMTSLSSKTSYSFVKIEKELFYRMSEIYQNLDISARITENFVTIWSVICKDCFDHIITSRKFISVLRFDCFHYGWLLRSNVDSFSLQVEP